MLILIHTTKRAATYSPKILTFKEKQAKAQKHEYAKYIKKNPNLTCKEIAEHFDVNMPKANGVLTTLRFLEIIGKNKENKYYYIGRDN